MNQKVSPAFKKFITAGKNDSRVLGPLERHVMARPRNTDRRTDVFHPSEMSKESWCYRSTYFQLLGHPSPKANTRIG